MQANRWLTTVQISPEAAGFDHEAVRLTLETHDIESRPLWKPMHMQPLFAQARHHGGDAAARAFADGLCLPSGSSMTDVDVDRVCGIIEALEERR